MSDWRRSLLKAIHAPVTQANLRFLGTWQRWEGGHTNNDATWNWLNTTMDAPGAIGAINSVGVRKFRSYQDGINATAMTLMNGHYNDIISSLQAGNPYKYSPSAGLQTWVSGSPTGNPAYAAKVLGGNVAPKVPYSSGAEVYPGVVQGGNGAVGNPAPATFRRGVDPFLKLAFQDDPEFLSVLRTIPIRVDPKGSLTHPDSLKKSGSGNDVTRIAATQIGKPYVFGSGPSTESFDCSDLIQWSYKQLGIDIPRTTYDQIKIGRAVNPNRESLKPGDLIFASPHHVVMYAGGGKVIAAPHTGTVVQYQPLSRFGKLYAVRRILR